MDRNRNRSFVLLLIAVSSAYSAPDGPGKRSIFPESSPPSSSSSIDVTSSNKDPYVAASSSIFPAASISSSGMKFPASQEQEGTGRVVAPEPVQQNQNTEFILPMMDSSHSATTLPTTSWDDDEVATNEAIDLILRSARAGKALDLSGSSQDLANVASDPVIQEQLANGNEVEARGIIRNKLCGLGLMPCGPHKGHRPHHYGGGGGGWGPGVQSKDVTLVQPVALKPVGYPIAAVPLHHKYGKQYNHQRPRPQYGPPPPPQYGPPPPQYGPPPGPQYVPHHVPQPIQVATKPALVEHIHHHVHHTPSSSSGPSYGNSVVSSQVVTSGGYGHGPGPVIGSGIDEYGLEAKKQTISIVPAPLNRIEDCTCVKISECAGYDIIGEGTSGREIIAGLGQPNFGQVGFGIDPRNKKVEGIESNATKEEEETESQEQVQEQTSQEAEEAEGRFILSSIEAQEDDSENVTTTTQAPSSRRRREVIQIQAYNQNQQPQNPQENHDDQIQVATENGDGVSEPRTMTNFQGSGSGSSDGRITPSQGEPRLIGSLLRDSEMLRNITRFAGYDFGNDPTQLVKVEGQQLRILGKLFGFEPTVGVSFGLPGGYHGGAYAPNLHPHTGVNPYQDGISLGPISVNPLLSFQKGKDKHKTKIFRPLVNLHITPNPKFIKEIKGLFKKGKGWGWGPEYNYAHPEPHYPHYPYVPTVPYPYPVPVVEEIPIKHKHHHSHYHYKKAEVAPITSYYSSPPVVTYQSSYGDGYGYGSSKPTYYGSSGDSFSSAEAYSTSSGGYPSTSYYPFRSNSNPTKEDKVGIADAAGSLLTKAVGGLREGITSISSLLDGTPGDNKPTGIRNQASGLTAGEESLLNTLLKEEGLGGVDDLIKNRERYRSLPITREEIAKVRDKLRSESSNANSNFDNSRGRGLIFDDNKTNPNFAPAPSETRLPIHASSLGITSSNPSQSSSSSQLSFPEEENNSFHHQDRGGRIIMTDSPNSNSQQNDHVSSSNSGSRVTFTDSRRKKRQIDDDDETNRQTNSTTTIPTTPSQGNHEEIQGRKRQLNIGGNCPGGYVCCRNPRRPQQPQYQPQRPVPVYQPTNQQQQFVGNPFGTSTNSISQNPFSPGQGQCGVRNARGITGRVATPGHVDGDTDYGEYPWQVAILKKDGYDNVYVCGGALIDSRHIITAAHCIKSYSPKDVRVRLGEWDVNHETEFYPHLERDVASISIHPEFYAGNLFNDVAIVRIDGFVDFRQNPHISPICVPSKTTDFTGQRCFVTGWGKDAFGERGKYQNVLKEVDLPIISNFECEQRLKRTRLGADFVLHPGFLCAGGEEGKDACKGDGGGPLVCDLGGNWQIGGIVSWGVGCGQAGVPGVYVKVSKYTDWINSVTGSGGGGGGRPF